MSNESLDRFGNELVDRLISRRNLLGSAGLAAAGFGLPGAAHAENPADGEDAQDAPRLPLKIAMAAGLSPESRQKLQAISPQITLVEAFEKEAAARAVADADVYFGQFPPEWTGRAKRLRWVQFGSAGVETVLTPAFINSPILLTNAKGCYAPEIAEHAFALLFSFTRNLAGQVRLMREKKWDGAAATLRELRGATMGIVGFGGIGRETARRAKAMDMRVVAADIQPFQREHLCGIADEIHLADEEGLSRVLTQADVVLSAVPHTRRSEKMLGAREFSLMKRGAYFINVSRGKVADTNAIIKALHSGHLAGAGLDVTDPEPLPASHPLWDAPNVVITSHTAGQSQFAWPRTEAVFVENVRRFVHNLPLLNQVDKQAGF